MSKDIILVVDYHDENSSVRRYHTVTGEQSVLSIKTTAAEILKLVRETLRHVPPGGQVVWIMESTTGWRRVKDLIGKKVEFVLANVLQMPLPPKARRRKTDKVDTARLLREYLSGTLPRAFQTPQWLQRVRRVTGLRENLISRRTALTNYIDRYLAHESWESREGLWTVPGLARLRGLVPEGSDRFVIETKLAELEELQKRLPTVEAEIRRIYRDWTEAQWVDEIKGIGDIGAVSILARIGCPERFENAEALIAYAGLAPGVHQSDETVRTGHLVKTGTDKHLRFYLLEASMWARLIPRYQKVYERVERKRGRKIARLVVARHLLRSIYQMLKHHVRFDQLPAA